MTVDLPYVPDEHQPDVQPDWCGYLAAEAAQRLREAGEPTLADHVEDLERYHASQTEGHLYSPPDPEGDMVPPWARWLAAQAEGLVAPLSAALAVALLVALRPEYGPPVLAVVATLTAVVMVLGAVTALVPGGWLRRLSRR